MGRLFLIDLNERQIPAKPLYLCLCRTCKTHIALNECLIHQYPEVEIGVFNNIVNVVIDGPALYREAKSALDNTAMPDTLLANVYCVKCNDFLGNKIVQVGENSLHIVGMHHMFLKKLLFWNNEQPAQQPHQDA